ncbi:hypothetical protein [Listeria booriae]|nr:hypothetical protein [Listeria booriae]MBC1794175.1 hypothetical protein [Listeria booriae]MBC1813588.1 hypothetical protein [Listeria booriae]
MTDIDGNTATFIRTVEVLAAPVLVSENPIMVTPVVPQTPSESTVLTPV